MRSAPLVLASALAASLLLAGCSGEEAAEPAASGSAGSGTGAGAGSSTGLDVSGVEADEELAALLPADVAEAGTLVVGTDASYAPAEYIDEDGTTVVGYDVDLITAVAARLGLEADVQPADFTGIIPAIGSRYDVGMSSFTITAERLEQVNMISYFEAGEAYAVPAGNPDGVDPDNLCGLVVGVQTGTVEDEEMEATLIPECEAAGNPVEPLRFEAQSDVTTALVGGRADVMWADSPIIAYAVEQTGGQLEQLGDVFASAPQGVVVAKDDAELTEAVQAALQSLIDDGTYGEILAAWGNDAGAVETAELNPAVD
ncbi:ABC transporter substrate-binding protein [Cellulomonas marina]|uniref:Polar amino acid transport system substrate-binding protein n=1 Tax=Cellulomonas marina TaxID=988821 RepID=A0A1I0W416_9CELL|nr:ABC transporter substrate-binding protein [Cellulomonas marina]GIG29985.1 ABC transporter substrate-binding protein [Cellulomonas marina]SFA83479.1 polar amino acid transport system substrate-binding protein [Cellulomonas marina]